MRIGAWNVDYAKPSELPRLRRTLAKHEADIWVLTETHDALRPRWMRSAVCPQRRPDDASAVRFGSRWVSVWSRFPISRLKLGPGARRISPSQSVSRWARVDD
jgi:hypothetical protein